MSKLLKSLVLATCLWFSIVPAVAQTRDNALRNMNTVEVLVEDINADSKTCELDRELIIRSIKYPFSSAKFKTVDEQYHKDIMAKIRGLFKDQQSRIAAIYASGQRGDTTPEDAAKQSQAASDEYEKKYTDIRNEISPLTFYVNVLSLCIPREQSRAYLISMLRLT